MRKISEITLNQKISCTNLISIFPEISYFRQYKGHLFEAMNKEAYIVDKFIIHPMTGECDRVLNHTYEIISKIDLGI